MEELKTLPEYLKAVNADGTAVLEATASWCSQCKAIAPFVEEMRKKYPDARFYTYDTDTAGDIAQELGVSQMPTVSLDLIVDMVPVGESSRLGNVEWRRVGIDGLSLIAQCLSLIHI